MFPPFTVPLGCLHSDLIIAIFRSQNKRTTSPEHSQSFFIAKCSAAHDMFLWWDLCIKILQFFWWKHEHFIINFTHQCSVVLLEVLQQDSGSLLDGVDGGSEACCSSSTLPQLLIHGQWVQEQLLQAAWAQNPYRPLWKPANHKILCIQVRCPRIRL